MSLKIEIAQLLENYSDLLELNNDNPFRIKALRKASEIILSLDDDLEYYLNSGEIANIKGIGKGILSIIEEFKSKGKVEDYERLKSKYPATIWELFNIKGLGAKKIKLLYDQLGVSSVDSLAKACEENQLLKLKGFSAQSQRHILEEINKLNEAKKYILLDLATKYKDEILAYLSTIPDVIKCEVTGELRRINEVISKIEIVVLAKNIQNVKNVLSEKFLLNDIIDESNYLKLVFNYEFNKICEIYVINKPQTYTKILFESTGSKAFLEKLNYSQSKLEYNSEEEIFKTLNHCYVIPEMREEQLFDYPVKLQLATDLSIEHFQGLLHFHTNYSDGLNSLEEMRFQAQKMGFRYIAVCDHSKSAFYANGMDEKKILQQKSLIEKLNQADGPYIYHGIECDILSNGKLDYDDQILKVFDFVVISVHSNFGLNENEMTNRLIKAIENQYSDLLGHPSGRLLLAREPYKVSMYKVIDACKENNVAIEINANPQRLDLDWRFILPAREKGCKFSINPDAHSISSISEINYGIMVARKGGLQVNEVINCYNIKKFDEFLNRKVNRKNKGDIQWS
ncbi:PHP domain-containing protein [Melioribacteraceae bacterium 4301-Me]|uniref:PHP domain-containing protein n=1 Tax=Pyranulibacter aquaticus TaxID=3163344 RepID=UPI003594AE68